MCVCVCEGGVGGWVTDTVPKVLSKERQIKVPPGTFFSLALNHSSLTVPCQLTVCHQSKKICHSPCVVALSVVALFGYVTSREK